MMKKIYLKPRFPRMKLHALYDILKNFPPEGYTIVSPKESQNHIFTKIASKHRNYLYKQFLQSFGSLPYILKQINSNVTIQNDVDLIYASQHVIKTEKNWIVDLEYSNALSGYLDIKFSKNIISKQLTSNNCKCIIPWSKWSLDTLKNSFDTRNFSEKIKIVRYTVPPKNFSKPDNETIKFLFLGSTNPANIDSFEFKGMYETIDAFLEIQKDFENVELVIRSIVPQYLKEKLRNYNNITILEKPLPAKELENLFQISDIFPHSGFEVLNLSVLEAMSYGLPVIATSLYNAPELIQNMKNGILIDLPKPKLFYAKNGAPNDYSKQFLVEMRRLRPVMTKRLVENFRLLIENKKLRSQIGKQAKLTIEEGEFSLKKRNGILKEIFETSI